jgi:hypothetical protein
MEIHVLETVTAYQHATAVTLAFTTSSETIFSGSNTLAEYRILDELEVCRERFIVHIVHNSNRICVMGRELCQLAPMTMSLFLLELLFRDRASL